MAADAAASKKVRLTSLRSVPATVEAGKRFRVRARVVNLPKSRKKSVRLSFTLRQGSRAGDTRIFSCEAADLSCVVPSA